MVSEGGRQITLQSLKQGSWWLSLGRETPVKPELSFFEKIKIKTAWM
jgi:hypothetical protein